MSAERRFEPRGRKFAPVALLLGLFLVGDAVWCVYTERFWAAVVVGGVGVERLLYALTDYLHRRLWPYRLSAARLEPTGVVFEEKHAYGGEDRTTVLPAGLVLDARVQRGSTRGIEADWAVLLFTILGTVVWSLHDDEDAADADLRELKAVLEARPEADLEPPPPTGALDIIPDKRGIMWGTAPLVPVSIALRAAFLLATIVAVPNLAGGMASMMLWGLTGLTVVLLAFPFLGAVSMLRRRGRLIGYGMTAQFGELRAWERSTVSEVVPLRSVRHVGFGDLALNGEPLALRLVAHTEPQTQIEAIVPRSAAANLAEQACKLVADLHEVRTDKHDEWSVPLPGGIAEAIEAVSWAQRFIAEAREERPDVVDA